MIDDFSGQPETRWRFFTDGVMGGVSIGGVSFGRDAQGAFAHMTGRVSTRNNGGFIQIQTAISQQPPARAQGLRLVVRGDGQRYFVHLKTSATAMPWDHYRAGFDTGPDCSPDWTEVRLPFAAFVRSRRGPQLDPRAERLLTLGLVAYGRDHDADIALRSVGYF
ncbi:CIA30 family protein [Phaeovulum veldkampii]|nr:CIA30 family protein [Phaeovulum veldkampii]TDQ62185.1 complex I intermediate-associated protein 30 (CIA30) [Phaeovulum veldkampii DSM 11550]